MYSTMNITEQNLCSHHQDQEPEHCQHPLGASPLEIEEPNTGPLFKVGG